MLRSVLHTEAAAYKKGSNYAITTGQGSIVRQLNCNSKYLAINICFNMHYCATRHFCCTE